jgi:DNA repair exonuclease SbcCD ATPase subunit
MKTIAIDSFELLNFMGFESYSRAGLAATSWRVSGGNGIGKSTLEKALRWCCNLYVADEIKPRDENNKEIPDLETSAEFVFIVGGERVVVQKTCTDVGENNRKVSNQFKYYTNYTARSKSEFNAQLSELFGVSMDVLRVILTPFGFSIVHWKELRDILTDTLPDSADADWIAHSKFSHLAKHIGMGIGLPSAIADTEKQARDKNKQLAILQAACKKAKPDKPQQERPLPEATKKALDNVNHLEQKLIEYKSGAGHVKAIAEKEAEITQLDNEIEKAGRRYDKDVREIVQAQREQEAEQDRLMRLKEDHQKEIAQLEVWKKNLAVHLEKLKVAPKVETVCSQCDQVIPEADIAKVRAKANREQVKAIRSVNAAGQEHYQAIKEHEAAIALLKPQLAEGTQKLTKFVQQLDDLIQPYKDEKQVIQDKIIALQTDIKQLQTDVSCDEALKNLEDELKAAKETKDSLSNQANEWESYDKLLEAAKDTTEQKQLSKQISTADALAASLKEASMAKNTDMETQLNEQLKVQIKLFSNPMQGDTKETCKVLVNGVEFGVGLNTAAAIEADNDIKRLLMNRYGVAIPVFTDTVESATDLIALDTQCFYLEVIKPLSFKAWCELTSSNNELGYTRYLNDFKGQNETLQWEAV